MKKSINTVYDTKNNMIWQDTNDNISLKFSQKDAITYCKNLKLNGKDNWHLAKKDEYKLILDKKNKHQINRAFNYSMPDDYWISDVTWRNFGQYGYYLFLKSGTFYYDNKSYKKFARCVRLKILK
jgi:hypothetical protein